MEELLQIGLGLFGGLALFLYGMNLMSSNLQEAAGERMRAILAAVTKNPFFGVLAGALATAVLQSSSATTVMAIGFVAAGLMGLRQAIPIIMGANIGTTITAQIIAFKLSDYVLGIVLVGFLIMQLAKQGQMKYVGTAVFGFGLLFLGIDTMGAVMKPLAENPVFTDLIAQVTGVPVLGVLVGTLMTLVVQSSSATIAVLQNFASTPAPMERASSASTAPFPSFSATTWAPPSRRCSPLSASPATPSAWPCPTASSTYRAASCSCGSSGPSPRWWRPSLRLAPRWKLLPGRSPTPTRCST